MPMKRMERPHRQLHPSVQQQPSQQLQPFHPHRLQFFSLQPIAQISELYPCCTKWNKRDA